MTYKRIQLTKKRKNEPKRCIKLLCGCASNNIRIIYLHWSPGKYGTSLNVFDFHAGNLNKTS